MSKVRINDLAKELEVKSNEIIALLPQVGITKKMTHSNSVEDHEAEQIKKLLAAKSGSSEATKKAVKAQETVAPKFDFSKLTKPGELARALKGGTAEPAKPAAAKPTAAAVPAIAVKTAAPKPAAIPKPEPEVLKPAIAIATKVPAAVAIKAKDVVFDPKKEKLLAQAHAKAVEKATADAPKPEASSALMELPSSETVGSIHAAADVVAKPSVETKATPPVPPVRRMVTPHAGPRPVYTAPANVPGVIVRGQPIFQRPRPAAPGGAPSGAPRPGLRPGERRPMHPTRTSPTGARPPIGAGRPGTGMPPPAGGAPPAGRPTRRPGARYEPRGIKEGPMKGYVPPSRMTPTEAQPISRTITITEGVSVKDLAEKLGVRAKDVIARLLVRGVFATVNQTLDGALAKEMSNFFGAETDIITFEEQVTRETEETLGTDTKKEEYVDGSQRPPVVTVMGHVDHGKTSLLDAIRETDVAGGEAGGITQHIGAYKVRIGKKDSPAFGREITFLDTPGHEAFTRMRARGASVTDIVVLVVAADDGVMPQTLEAMDHAAAAKVPIIVAVNKIDKPEAMPDRVKKQLADRGLLPEDWGGKTVYADVSAKKRTNIDYLLEMICLTADLQGLKANAERPATGSVVEAKLDRGRGAVATILVQNGTLRNGDTFIVGNTFGKVRAMFDDRGKAIDSAPPSTPVEVLGLEGMPSAGDQLIVVADRDKAKNIAHYRETRAREAVLAKSHKLTLEGLATQIATAGVKELPVILKGDVGGSVEVIADTLNKLSTEKVKIKVLHTGVGAITESDVLLATASNAIIIGFNVRPERKAAEVAEMEQVDIRLHSIIYELQDELRKAMTGLLEPIVKETVNGHAIVRETFRIPKVGVIAGCMVQDGLIKRDSEVRLLRDNIVVFKGKISSLRRFKDDASEVRSGNECGISIAGYGDVKVGDVIECFSSEKVAAVL